MGRIKSERESGRPRKQLAPQTRSCDQGLDPGKGKWNIDWQEYHGVVYIFNVNQRFASRPPRLSSKHRKVPIISNATRPDKIEIL